MCECCGCDCKHSGWNLKNMEMQKEIWMCFECGRKYGELKPGIATCHVNTCDWCKKEKCVTHFRHYGYPRYTEETETQK